MKKFTLLFALIAFAFVSCDKTKDENIASERKGVHQKKGGQGHGNNPSEPTPLPCGRVFPDPIMTNVVVNAYQQNMSLTFDPVPSFAPGDSICYSVFYLMTPQPTPPVNGQVVLLDGVYYRQATACYWHLPIWIWWGWSPMYFNVIYTVRIGVYSSSGCYQYSQPFTIDTSL